MGVHRAQRRRQQNKEQAATLCGPQDIDLAGHENCPCSTGSNLRIQQHHVQLIFAHAIDCLPRVLGNKNLVTILGQAASDGSRFSSARRPALSSDSMTDARFGALRPPAAGWFIRPDSNSASLSVGRCFGLDVVAFVLQFKKRRRRWLFEARIVGGGRTADAERALLQRWTGQAGVNAAVAFGTANNERTRWNFRFIDLQARMRIFGKQ